jgi:hypothetical protein
MMKERIGTIARLGLLAFAATACVAAPAITSTPGTPTSAETTDPSRTAPPVTVLTTILDDAGCRLDGEVGVEPGPIEISVSNQDPKDRASFQLLRIHENGTFEELAAHVDEEQERIDAGGDPIGIPAYASEVVGTLIVAGETDQLETTLPAGTYAMVCADWADGGAAGSAGNHPNTGGRILIAGPLTVSAAEG